MDLYFLGVAHVGVTNIRDTWALLPTQEPTIQHATLRPWSTFGDATTVPCQDSKPYWALPSYIEPRCPSNVYDVLTSHYLTICKDLRDIEYYWINVYALLRRIYVPKCYLYLIYMRQLTPKIPEVTANTITVKQAKWTQMLLAWHAFFDSKSNTIICIPWSNQMNNRWYSRYSNTVMWKNI